MICTANTALYFQCGVSASPVKKGQTKQKQKKTKKQFSHLFLFTLSVRFRYLL